MQAFTSRPAARFKELLGTLGVLILTSLPLGGCAGEREEESPVIARDRVPLLGRAAITVAPGIHLLGGLAPSVAYVVESSDGPVLVDWCLQGGPHLLKA